MLIMEVLSIILIGISAILIILHISLRLSIRNIGNQLNYINKVKSNAKLLLPTNNKELKKLVLDTNKLLEEKQKIEIEYKRIEQELRQTISNMSHDLRTPLTSIMGYIQLIEEDNLTCGERAQYIDIVKRRTKALQALITSFYDLSRLDAKEYKLQLKTMNLGNVMLDTLAFFYNDFINKGIEPSINIDEKAALIIADENALRRVLTNLIQNMIKYSKGNVGISLEKQGDYFITTFKNKSESLTEEQASHLFERFYTADRSRSDNSTGLGLFISKALVEQMGHEISASLYNNELSIIIRWKSN
jgi:signal transduction histidine kinase